MRTNPSASSAVTTFEVLSPPLASQIDAIVASHQNDASKLVGILLEVQDIVPRQYIPTEVAAYVGDRLGLPLSRLYDVISFYEALADKPRADYVIQICDSVVCNVVGNRTLKESLETTLGIAVGAITPDAKFMLSYTPCFGACDVAPAIRVNGEVYGNLDTADKVKAVIASLG